MTLLHMAEDPLGLAGKVIKIDAFQIEKLKTKRVRSKKEAIELLKDIFKSAKEEKMRRKWDLKE